MFANSPQNARVSEYGFIRLIVLISICILVRLEKEFDAVQS